MRAISSLIDKYPRTEGACPICEEPVFFAGGRGLCTECQVTFPEPRISRKEVLSVFAQRFFMSKLSGYYHREGCKYLKNVTEDNLIVISEPLGKPCRCIR